MNAFVLGGSKNIGYYTALRLLKKGYSVTFLLRQTNVFDDNEEIKPYIEKGKVRLVSGDGLNYDDVKKGWEAALEHGNGTLDFVLFTIGGAPNFQLTKGFVLTTPDLCTRSLLNLLRSMPASLRAPAAQPRIAVVTSRAITHAAHATLPWAFKPMYGYLLAGPHRDKFGAERVLAHALGRPWAEEEPHPDILPPGWRTLPGLPAEGALERVVIVRPALLTDGECVADSLSAKKAAKGRRPYRAVAGEVDGGYTVSRKDTAHFIAEDALPNWEKWEGKGVVLVY